MKVQQKSCDSMPLKQNNRVDIIHRSTDFSQAHAASGLFYSVSRTIHSVCALELIVQGAPIAGRGK